MVKRKDYAKLVIIAGSLILWAGLIIGVSFIGTPLKFKAIHLSMPVAIEIGKVTFNFFNKVEWGFFFIIIIITAGIKKLPLRWLFIGTLTTLLLIETFALLPALNIRAEEIIQGGAPNPGMLHSLYIVADMLKILISLLGATWIFYYIRSD